MTVNELQLEVILEKILTSAEFFGKLSNGGLADYYHLRRKYRQTVDDIVLTFSPENPVHLDVGSAEGNRATRLSYSLNSQITFCDNCPEMVKILKTLGETIEGNIEDLFFKEELFDKFDLITCLGNVVGHSRSIHLVVESCKKLLKPGGVLIMDVHNRHNVKAYGWKSVTRNYLKDNLNYDYGTGYFPCQIGENKTLVKIHTEAEVEVLKFDGLKLSGKYYVNYETGNIVKNQFLGQLVYVLQKNQGSLGV